MSQPIPSAFEKNYYGKLAGRTITRIEWKDFEGRAMPVLVLDNGKRVEVWSDAEGNGAGFLNHAL